ncbi:MAG: glycosyltransferase family 4 protein [Planctomycetes bacterium]|nr:glycosyltransferase family 4 protein [Planctomycetota bacterium]
MKKLTAVHVTHEAAEQYGGIGTVLEGILTSPVYQDHVERSILIGPFAEHIHVEPSERLGPRSKLLFSSMDGIDELDLKGRLQPIEWAFDVKIIYGRREFVVPGTDRTGEAEVVLIDVFKINQERLNKFKLRLYERLGIDSKRYESAWEYEEYVRLAVPAYHALLALLRREQLPCLLFSHEFMGLPTAFKCIMDGESQFRTIFHAHECAMARRLVETHPGHDTRFYNVLQRAQAEGRYVNDVFGDQSDSFRHALISQAHLCDGIIAVGDYTAEEVHFLGPHFDRHRIDMVYNGVPANEVTIQQRTRSRRMLTDYAEALLGWRPDVLMTHVTRPVVSKGLWRDFTVCHELDARFAATGRTGVLFILTTAGGRRRSRDVRSMEVEYGWPREHRHGYPDLVGPEIELNEMVESFNAEHSNVQVVLVNQFGWSRHRIGRRLPVGMDIADLRAATDVEFGMATYEPFGISPLEPLGSGALCVISNVCGCKGFVEYVTDGRGSPNVIVADFTRLDRPRDLDGLLELGWAERDEIERRVCAEVADELVHRLPRDDAGREALLASGQEIVPKLGWDQVLEHRLIGMLQRVVESDEELVHEWPPSEGEQPEEVDPSPEGRRPRKRAAAPR